VAEKPIKKRLLVRHMLGLYGIVGIQASVSNSNELPFVPRKASIHIMANIATPAITP
jgi:hypothetical protein